MKIERRLYALNNDSVRKVRTDEVEEDVGEETNTLPKTARLIEEAEIPKDYLEQLLRAERTIREIAPPLLASVRQFYRDGVGDDTVYYLYGTYPSTADGKMATAEFLVEAGLSKPRA